MRPDRTACDRIRAAMCAVGLVAASGSCHRRATGDRVPEAMQPDYEKTSVAVMGEPVVAPAPRCTVVPQSAHTFGPDGGSSFMEGAVLGRTPGAIWTAWIERAGARVALASADGPVWRAAFGTGEPEPPVLVPLGPDRAVAAVLVQQGTLRAHHVWSVSGPTGARELFVQREGNDDALGDALVATRAGALIAWDEDRGPTMDGVIQAQFVPRAALEAGAAIAPPAVRALTPEGDDAAEPQLVAMPDGRAVLVYLTAQDVDVDAEANATASDIWLRALSAEGLPVGEPVKITPGPANRFGAVALANAGALWVAYRVAGDSDQESQGDGGLVAIVRVGADLHPTASPAYVSSSEAQPTGSPAVVADGAGVTVFWTERRGDEVHTMRRPVEPDGHVLRAALEEPVLDGQVPAGGARDDLLVAVAAAGTPTGYVRVHCPDVPRGH